jgi:hypothetical protein
MVIYAIKVSCITTWACLWTIFIKWNLNIDGGILVAFIYWNEKITIRKKCFLQLILCNYTCHMQLKNSCMQHFLVTYNMCSRIRQVAKDSFSSSVNKKYLWHGSWRVGLTIFCAKTLTLKHLGARYNGDSNQGKKKSWPCLNITMKHFFVDMNILILWMVENHDFFQKFKHCT